MENITVRDILKATKGRLLAGSEEQPLCHLSIDSRNMRGQDLFVPLVGERTNAHRFIQQALDNGAAATLTCEHQLAKSRDGKAWIRVEDTKQALQAIGAYYRSRIDLPLVGITGSVGKTTTREMVAAALSAGYRVYKTPANHNSQIGVPLTLSEITGRDEIGVIELGMSEPGEMTVIARLARIDMALITNVGVTHIEQLGSRENILREKLHIQDGLREGGILLLNGDNDLLREVKGKPGISTVYYGTGENCSYRALDIRLEDGFPRFTLVHKEERIPVKLSVMGEHNVQNAVAALAVADIYGVSLMEAAVSLEQFCGFNSRQQVCRQGGITVIDDSYNASPDSMRAAIQVLASMDGGKRRIAVLADMKELGEQAQKFHYEIGEFLLGLSVDQVVLLGSLASRIGEAVMEHSGRIEVHCFQDRDAMTEYLKEELRDGDCVLFKGSNSMKLGEVAAHFIRRDETESS